MDKLYSEGQKTLIMLMGDLLGEPLALEEKMGVQDALATVDGDVETALAALPPEIKAKVSSLLSKGLRLSFELDKLGQRGVSILLPEERAMGFLEGFFSYRPSILFIAGEKSILDREDVPVSFSLDSFEAAGCEGVFIADRPFDSLLRDRRVAAALRKGCALLVSDVVKSRATIKVLPVNHEGRNGKTVSDRLMKHVFISGSRSQAAIPKAAQDSLEAIIKQGIGIYIGDSNRGVDNEIIDFLRAPLYEHVTIFTIAEHPRVNPEPEWGTRTVAADKSLKPQQRQMVKDRAMAEAADWGLALFNPIEKNRYGSLQVSSGTLRNAIQMLLQGKMVKFFYQFEGEMVGRNLKTLNDLELLIEGYQFEHLGSLEQEMILSSKGVSAGDDASSVKFRTIMAKYKSLLKDEKKLLEGDGDDGVPANPVQDALPLFG